MPTLEENAAKYQTQIRSKLEKQLPPKDVDIPFYSVRHTNQQLYLNPALDADAVDPRKATAADYLNYPLLRTDAVITKDGVQTEMVRRPVKGECCVIDWLSMTMQSSTFDDQRTTSQILPEFRQSAVIDNVSDVLKDIIGFGVEYEHGNGRNFYDRCFILDHGAGFVCIGGQNDTIMICINGTGCTYGKSGWEAHLHAWSNLFAKGFKITRLDLAHDDLYGDYTSVDWFNHQHTIGGFSRGGRPPNCEYRGDWKRPNGKGRSLYIGSKQSSQFCRIYEKGKQLGDSESAWLRTEVQFSSRGQYINIDALIKPSEFFTIAYPCFAIFEFDGKTDKFERIEKQNRMTWEQAIDLVKHQYGRYLHFFRSVFSDDSHLLDVLTDIENTKVPERIDPLTIPKLIHKEC